jgi:hypothetical protein
MTTTVTTKLAISLLEHALEYFVPSITVIVIAAAAAIVVAATEQRCVKEVLGILVLKNYIFNI